MNGQLRTGRLPGVLISTSTTAPMVVTVDGRPARLAILAEDGQVLAAGEDVAAELRACALNATHAHWMALGHLRSTNLAPAVAGTSPAGPQQRGRKTHAPMAHHP